MSKKIITLLFGITATLLLSGCGAFMERGAIQRGFDPEGELLARPSDDAGCTVSKWMYLKGYATACNEKKGDFSAGVEEFYKDTPEKRKKRGRLLGNIAKCNAYATRVTPLPTKEKVLSHYQTNIIIDESTLNANSLPPIVTTVPVYKEVRNRHTKEYIQNRTKCMQEQNRKAAQREAIENVWDNLSPGTEKVIREYDEWRDARIASREAQNAPPPPPDHPIRDANMKAVWTAWSKFDIRGRGLTDEEYKSRMGRHSEIVGIISVPDPENELEAKSLQEYADRYVKSLQGDTDSSVNSLTSISEPYPDVGP